MKKIFDPLSKEQFKSWLEEEDEEWKNHLPFYNIKQHLVSKDSATSNKTNSVKIKLNSTHLKEKKFD